MGKNERTLAHQHRLKETVSNIPIKIPINTVVKSVENAPKPVEKPIIQESIGTHGVFATLNGNIPETGGFPTTSDEISNKPIPKGMLDKPNHSKRSRKCKPCEQNEKLIRFAKKNKGIRLKPITKTREEKLWEDLES